MSQTTVLLTLGRLPKALELSRGFKARGCRVLVAEPFAWHVCRLSRTVDSTYTLPAPNSNPQAYRRALRELIAAQEVDLVVPVSEEAPHVVMALGEEPTRARLYSPSIDALMALHDKRRFAMDAIARDFSVPATFDAGSPEAAELAHSHATVLKPIHGCSGQGVQFLDQGTVAPATPRHIVQKRIDGRHVSSFSIVHNGAVRASVLYEGTLLSGTVAVCFRRVDKLPAVTDWIERFVREHAASGFVSFDFVVDADGTPWAIECNPRMTSGVHFFEAQDVAAAVLNPTDAPPVNLRTRTHFQQFYPALTEAYSAFLRPREFVRRMRTVLNARDVVFDRSDLKPFVLMTPASWPILRQTLFDGKSFGAASTADIMWTPDASET